VGYDDDLASQVLKEWLPGQQITAKGTYKVDGKDLRNMVKAAVQSGFKRATDRKPASKLPESNPPALGVKPKQLSVSDLIELENAVKRVFTLLSDGDWHSRTELVAAGGSEGTRRARELRPLFVLINPSERKRHSRYKLKKKVGVNYGDLDVSKLDYATNLEEEGDFSETD
jgi:hypothetical protein